MSDEETQVQTPEVETDQLVQTEPQDQTVNPNEETQEETTVELDQPENDSEPAQDEEVTE